MHNDLVSMAESHRRLNQNGELAAINRLKSLKFLAQGCQGSLFDPVCPSLSLVDPAASPLRGLLDRVDRVHQAPRTAPGHLRHLRVAMSAICM